ncbi:MAG: DNA repair photolyase [Candidatus Azotimanducaceae bacterium]|jgi:DNA repair photolyase
MKNKIVEVPSIKTPIKASPGFAKKELADYKLDIIGLCGFGCVYCSSNHGNYLRINRARFADMTAEQLGERRYPSDSPELTFQWPDIVEKLEQQLEGKSANWGSGKTLVFSMLTDGFSPQLLINGTTEKVLRMVAERTAFRIRILTKNAIVGRPQWIKLFSEYPDRFIVGLSTGSMNDSWAGKIEIGTSLPSARLWALQRLQDAGIPTFGMLCPVFPDVLDGRGVEQLVDAVRPGLAETVWAEPYNDRQNWQKVRDGYVDGSPAYAWFDEIYGKRNWSAYSKYTTDLYLRIRKKAEQENWLTKLKYLLYEGRTTAEDAERLGDMKGILLQGKPDKETGLSTNPYIRANQEASVGTL